MSAPVMRFVIQYLGGLWAVWHLPVDPDAGGGYLLAACGSLGQARRVIAAASEAEA